VKPLYLLVLLLANPALAQRPTAEVARPVEGFWPVEASSGTVVFTAPTARPVAPARWQAEHLRTWLTQTCGTAWSEYQARVDSVLLYHGQLSGLHAGVGLRFVIRVSRQPAGWQYRLFACEVRSPTGTDVVHWLPLHRLLDDSDFRPDVLHFQQQLQRALPSL
jgi:hypothetical protein